MNERNRRCRTSHPKKNSITQNGSFIAYFDRGLKVYHFLSQGHKSNPYINGFRGKQKKVTRCLTGKKCSIVYFDRDVNLCHKMSIHVTCRFMSCQVVIITDFSFIFVLLTRLGCCALCSIEK